MIDKQIRTLIKLAPAVKKLRFNDIIMKFHNYEIKTNIADDNRISYDIWINGEHEIINKTTRNIILNYIENYKNHTSVDSKKK